jgi:hypothetical protein
MNSRENALLNLVLDVHDPMASRYGHLIARERSSGTHLTEQRPMWALEVTEKDLAVSSNASVFLRFF